MTSRILAAVLAAVMLLTSTEQVTTFGVAMAQEELSEALDVIEGGAGRRLAVDGHEASYVVIEDMKNDRVVRQIEDSAAFAKISDKVVDRRGAVFTLDGQRFTVALYELSPSADNVTGINEMASFWVPHANRKINGVLARRLTREKGSKLEYTDLVTGQVEERTPPHELPEVVGEGAGILEHCYDHCYWGCVLLCLIGAPELALLCGPVCAYYCYDRPRNCG